MRIAVVSPFDTSWQWLARHAPLSRHEWSFHAIKGGLLNANTTRPQWISFALRAARSLPPCDLVVSHHPRMSLLLQAAMRLRLRREPHMAFSWNVNENGFFKQPLSLIASIELPRLTLAQTFSDHERHIHHARYRIPLERFAFHHWAVEEPRPAPGRDRRVPDGPYTLCMGRYNRDFDAFIAAMEPLPLRGVIICPRGFVDPARLPANVTLLHDLSLADCERIQATAACTVVPLKDAVTGAGHITLAASMHMGVPVVCSDVVTVRDYVFDGHNAVLAPPRDPAALRAAIERAALDEPTRIALAAAGREFARRWLTEPAAIASVAGVLDAFEAGRPIPLEPPGWSAWKQSIGALEHQPA